MEKIQLPQDSAKQWELILLLMSSEENKIDKTNENEIETVTYFYKNPGVKMILQQWLADMCAAIHTNKSPTDSGMKSDEIALLWRQRGNEKFRMDHIADSCYCYTKSVLYATKDESMFALALANRSAALSKLKKYKECLMDIKLALQSGYPSDLEYKLHLREADTHIELNQVEKAEASLAMAKQKSQQLPLSPSSRNDLDRNIKLVENKIQLASSSRDNEITYNEPKCHLGENEDFVNASAVLELKKNESYGRHVRARSDVQRGQILFVEDPYAFVALPVDGDLPIVCENCCQSNINPVPCSKCSRSIYCSEECRCTAWESFHQWECMGAMSQIWPTIGIAHLAMRVLLISTKNGFPKTKIDVNGSTTAMSLFKSYSEVNNVNAYKRSEETSFLRIFHLVTNFDMMNNTDYIQYALSAVMLNLYLENHTSFYDYLPTRLPYKLSQNEMRIFTTGLLLRHLGQLVCNGHAITGINEVPDGNRTSVEREIRLATAIYPSASMMNHSCDPNIINSFQRNRLVVKASRDLSAGDEVYNCYGPAYTREKCQQRKAQLRAQYLFNCDCPACVHPDKKDFILQFTAYACQSCKGPVIRSNKKTYCRQCQSTDLKLEKTLELLNQSEDLAKQAYHCDSAEQKCEKLQASLKLKQQVLHKHHVAVREAMDQLACFYAEIGEWNKSVEMIKQCVPSLEYQFGSFSVEVAHELRKLTDVMLERMYSQPQHSDFREWCLETHKIIKKALQLFELNYGPWDQSYKSLIEKEEVLRTLLAQNQHSNSDCSIHDLLHYNLKI